MLQIYSIYTLHITYAHLSLYNYKYVSSIYHLLCVSLILDTRNTALAILDGDQWQKYRVIRPVGKHFPFKTNWPERVPMKRRQWTKIYWREASESRLFLKPVNQEK